MSRTTQGLWTRVARRDPNGGSNVVGMARVIHKLGWAFVVVLTFLTVLVAAPVLPASDAEAQTIVNVALGKPTTQSSTDFGGVSGRAVDGNTNGQYNAGSVTHTANESNAWWQVDLQNNETIDSISLFNRTDCCQNRLSNFYVFASADDLTGRTFADIVADAGVDRVQVSGTVGTSVTLNDPLAGRFVRVQLAGGGILSLAEVQVNVQSDVQGVLDGDQWHQVNEPINLAVTWPADAEVVGLPAGLVFANGTVTGSVPFKGRWPVEVRLPGTTEYFQWLITDGAPGGVPSEHVAVDADAVSPRPMEGTDGVVWNRNNNDSTTSLDITVWDMQQVGAYMYVGGEFEEVIEEDTEQEHNQAYLARFSVDTGQWDPSFRPQLDGNVHALELNARGLLLVGGEFTNIDGAPGTEGLAAINPNTGQVDPSFEAWVERPWYPQGRAIVRELEVVGTYLYIGGNFSHINGPGGTRVRVHKAARVGANFGTIDPTWLPVISGGSVWGIGVDQDRGRVHLNGRFTSANGSTANREYIAVTTETGATVEGLLPRPLNQASRPELYDVEYAADRVWMAGSQHFVVGLDADTHALDFWQFAGNACTSTFCWSSSGTGGDFQFAEKIGNYVFSGCHCTDPYDRNGRPNHYSSVTNQRTTHRVAMAYSLDGTPSTTEFDIGGNIDGAWTAATDDVGCIWIGGDIIDGGFYEPGGRVFARGFARFCGDTPVPATPQNLVASTVTPSQVTLDWDQVPGATGYRVSRDGIEVATVDSGAFTSWTDLNVNLGGSYAYEVRAENRAGVLSAPQSVTVIIDFEDTEAPTAPTNVTAIDEGDGTVTIAWDASTDNVSVGSYLVYRDGAYIGFTAGDVTVFVDTPPVVGIPNLYEIRAVDVNDNRSELSDPGATVTVGGEDTEPPSVPQNVTATVDDDGTVTIAWDASTDNVGVNSYLVYRDGAYIGFTTAAVTSYVDTPPAEGVQYLYDVRAVDVNDNRSDKSDPVAITVGGTDVDPPSVPQNVTAVDVGDGTVGLSWDASTDNIGISSYLLYRDGAYLAWTPAGTTSYVDTPPSAGVEYFYEVRAVDVNDNRSDKSDPGATIILGGLDVEAPSVPANLAAVDVGDGTVALSWDASTDNIGISSYLLYRDGAYLAWTPDGTTTFVDTPPAAGVEYVYSVRAVDVNDNRSDRSSGVAVTIGGPDVEAPSVPANLAAVDVGDGTVALSWDASTDNIGISSYLLYRDGAYLAWTPDGTTSYVDTPPLEGVEYVYSVRAVDVNDNRSDRSSGVALTIGGPDVEAPSVPANLGLINPAAGATELIWDPSLDNVAVASYLIYRDGAYLAWTPGDVTTFVDATSVVGETYDYEVRATDANGNRSDKSAPLSVTIQ